MRPSSNLLRGSSEWVYNSEALSLDSKRELAGIWETIDWVEKRFVVILD